MSTLNLQHEGVVHGLGTAYVDGSIREVTWCLESFEWYVDQGASWVVAPVTCIGCLVSRPDLMVSITVNFVI